MKSTLLRSAKRLGQDDAGTTLVELAFAIVLFLFIFFGILDFGRMAFNLVAAEKAMQQAARIAAVRPAVCPGVPLTHLRDPVLPNPDAQFGDSCDFRANTCASFVTDCRGDEAVDAASLATVAEILAIVDTALPSEANASHLRFEYRSDPALGFLGGPFTPVVTVEIDRRGADEVAGTADDLYFRFLGALGGLAQLAGSVGAGGISALEEVGIPFPAMSASLPGEDLALGEAG